MTTWYTVIFKVKLPDGSDKWYKFRAIANLDKFMKFAATKGEVIEANVYDRYTKEFIKKIKP